MIRIAAVGDVHLGAADRGTYRARLRELGDQADVFLIAGDLTRRGTRDEARVVAEELAELPVPVFAVLGNHDYESDGADTLVELLDSAGVRVLEGDAAVCELAESRVGFAGVKGFGGGFPGRCGTRFGEPEMKAFVGHTEDTARRLESALSELEGLVDAKVALMHYSPVAGTLAGEHCEIYPFLGSYLLAEAVDAGGARLAIHGHAHAGAPRAVTPGGTPVRNVALPVIRSSYRVFCLSERELEEAPTGS